VKTALSCILEFVQSVLGACRGSRTRSAHTRLSKLMCSVRKVYAQCTFCALAHSVHTLYNFNESVEMVCTRALYTLSFISLAKQHKSSNSCTGSKLVVLLLGQRMVGGPHNIHRRACSRCQASPARHERYLLSRRTLGGGNRSLLPNRNKRPAARWPRIDVTVTGTM
jgi:hypothetical protein